VPAALQATDVRRGQDQSPVAFEHTPHFAQEHERVGDVLDAFDGNDIVEARVAVGESPRHVDGGVGNAGQAVQALVNIGSDTGKPGRLQIPDQVTGPGREVQHMSWPARQ